MTFYQELQLNQADSKQLIRNATSTSEKLRHIAIYLFKIFITIAFCMTVVIGYSTLFGNDNSIVGVVFLLCLLMFRNVDLDIDTTHALPTLLFIFLILAFGPRFAHASPLLLGLIINLICIGLIMVLGCHNVMKYNHSTLVLSYLLLYSYDVTGHTYNLRLVALALGALFTGIVYYRNHKHKDYEHTFTDLLKSIDFHSSRTKWQIALTLGVSSVLFIAEFLGMPRAMWASIATLSIMVPIEQNVQSRVKPRILGNLVGGILVFMIYTYCPDFISRNIGILGGIGVGLSATYGFQAAFNALSAIATASTTLGLPCAILYRIFHNAFGAIYGFVFHKAFYRYMNRLKKA